MGPPRDMGNALEAVQERLSLGPRLRRRLSVPDFAAIREFVRLLDKSIVDLNRAAGLKGEKAQLVRRSVLQASFLVLVACRHLQTRLAHDLLVSEWTRAADVTGALPAGFAGRIRAKAPPSEARLKSVDPADQEFLAPFNTAVFLEALVDPEAERHAPETLRRLATQLELSQDQLGRMLGVSGETVRRWQQGSHRVPTERLAQLTEAESALGRLLEMFRPERLAQVLRRKADLFEGEGALDWILRGRIKDVANRYETALAYQA